jgi:hypothetical protein
MLITTKRILHMFNKKLLFCSLFSAYFIAAQTDSMSEYTQAVKDLENYVSEIKIEKEVSLNSFLAVNSSSRYVITGAAQKAYNKYTNARHVLESKLLKRALLTGAASGAICSSVAHFFLGNSIATPLSSMAVVAGTALGTVITENNKLGIVPYFEWTYKSTYEDKQKGIYRGYEFLDKKENLVAHTGSNSISRCLIQITTGWITGGLISVLNS